MSETDERILVRSVNWLGDAVMSTPALIRLREARPRAHITLLTPEKLSDLWKGQPYLDEVISFTAAESPLALGSRLKPFHFSTGLILPNSPRSALEMWCARIPRRIGYSRPFRNLLLTTAITPRPGEMKMRKRGPSEIRRLISSPGSTRERFPNSAHHVHQYLHLVAEAFGGDHTPIPPRIEVPEADQQSFRDRFQISETSYPLFGLNAGAEYGSAKRWPKERFVAAAVELHQITKCTWLIFGGKGDRELADQIHSGILREAPGAVVLNLSGRTSLSELRAALKICRVVLTNDTGPMHVASAVGTPVVVPFGSTSPDLTGPGWGDEQRALNISKPAGCAPCFLRECPIDFRCMLEITPDEVITGVLKQAGLR